MNNNNVATVRNAYAGALSIDNRSAKDGDITANLSLAG
jgi:hypothetical protein